MASELRILHTGDSHIGADLPLRRRRPGRRRGDDLIDSFNHVIDRAIECDVQMLLHCGDLFDTPHPHIGALNAAGDALLRAADEGIEVVVIPGNHERCAIPMTLQMTHGRIHVLDKPRTVTLRLAGVSVSVSGFPCLRKRASEDLSTAIEQTRWQATGADIRLLVVHEAFESATCGPGNFRFRDGESVSSRGDVPDAFDYVACGHIHRRQDLYTPNGGPPIVYCGSPDRIAFAEVGETKGCVLIEQNGNGLVHRFIEHDVRPMCVCPLDVTGLSSSAIEAAVEAIAGELPESAVAQIRLAGVVERRAWSAARLTAAVRQVRSDLEISFSTRGVELSRTQSKPHTNKPIQSVFDDVFPGSGQPLRVGVNRIGALPTMRGVYALFGDANTLLYIGKAANIRSRVSQHVRSRGIGHFAGWARAAKSVETLRSYGDLEARVVEAELIRRFEPPFNQQMSRWRRYRYLRAVGREFERLIITSKATPDGRYFGPFRSRTHARMIRDAVAFAFDLPGDAQDRRRSRWLQSLPEVVPTMRREVLDRIGASMFIRGSLDNRLRRRDACLSGDFDDDVATRIDDAIEGSVQRQIDDPIRCGGLERLRTLRSAMTLSRRLRDAERLIGCEVQLDASPGSRRLAMVTRDGVRFREVTESDTATISKTQSIQALATAARNDGRLPAAMVDVLCCIVTGVGVNSEQQQIR